MSRDIGVDANINRIRLAEQGSAPSTPASGYGYLYIKTDGVYFKGDNGTEIGPLTGTAPSRVLIEEVVPVSTGTITFSSIPSTYRHLEIEVIGRSTKVATYDDVRTRFNNDTTDSNYRYAMVQGYTNSSQGLGGDGVDNTLNVAAASSPSNSCGVGYVNIPYYKDTTFYKQAIIKSALRLDTNALHELAKLAGIEWENTAAITRVDLILAGGNWVTGSVARLYGIY